MQKNIRNSVGIREVFSTSPVFWRKEEIREVLGTLTPLKKIVLGFSKNTKISLNFLPERGYFQEHPFGPIKLQFRFWVEFWFLHEILLRNWLLVHLLKSMLVKNKTKCGWNNLGCCIVQLEFCLAGERVKVGLSFFTKIVYLCYA